MGGILFLLVCLLCFIVLFASFRAYSPFLLSSLSVSPLGSLPFSLSSYLRILIHPLPTVEYATCKTRSPSSRNKTVSILLVVSRVDPGGRLVRLRVDIRHRLGRGKGWPERSTWGDCGCCAECAGEGCKERCIGVYFSTVTVLLLLWYRCYAYP